MVCLKSKFCLPL